MSATAVADVAAQKIHAVVEIAAPPERVFRALTEPHELAAWWGSADTYQTFDWSIDLRPGGQWSCQARIAGADRLSSVRGEYRVIEPPRLLEYTFLASWEEFAPTLVRIEIEPSAIGARVTVLHTGKLATDDAYGGIAEGWQRILDWLNGHLVPGAAEVSP
jgi:uncharacterized protein YndB with AHSA1/START domain